MTGDTDITRSGFVCFLIIIFFCISPLFSCASNNKFFESIEARQKIKAAIDEYKSQNWKQRFHAIKEISDYIGPTNFESGILLKENNLNYQLLEALLIKASNDIHASIQIEALRGLAVLKSRNAYSKIEKIAIDENEEDNVRWYAITTISVYRNPASFNVFIKGLGSDDWIVREASIKGLAALEGIINDSLLVEPVVRAINDENQGVQIAALKNITIKKDSIYSAIVNLFESKEKANSSLLEAILTALNGYKLDGKTRERVINLLGHPDRDVRLLALKVLKKEKSVRSKKN